MFFKNNCLIYVFQRKHHILIYGQGNQKVLTTAINEFGERGFFCSYWKYISTSVTIDFFPFGFKNI